MVLDRIRKLVITAMQDGGFKLFGGMEGTLPKTGGDGGIEGLVVQDGCWLFMHFLDNSRHYFAMLHFFGGRVVVFHFIIPFIHVVGL